MPNEQVVVIESEQASIDVEVQIQPGVMVETFPPAIQVAEVIVTGPQGVGGFEGHDFSFRGIVSPIVGKTKMYCEARYRITSVRVSVDEDHPPTGRDLICDVLLNKTSIFASDADRPRIADGLETGVTRTFQYDEIAPGQYLTTSVLQVGSTTPGQDLVLTVRLQWIGAV